jgi:hypothetical protein
MARRPSTGRSVRIDSDVDEQLRALARERGLSVNTLTGRALARFVEWDSFGEKFGFVDMPAIIVQRIVKYLSDDDVRDLGRWVGTTLVREHVLFWFKDITPHTVLEAYPRLASRYGRLFEFSERIDGANHIIVLKHSGGPKLSLLYAEIIRSAFEKLLQIRVDIEATENQVVARFATVPGSAPPSPRVAPAGGREPLFGPPRGLELAAGGAP